MESVSTFLMTNWTRYADCHLIGLDGMLFDWTMESHNDQGHGKMKTPNCVQYDTSWVTQMGILL
jgi:hypothetical protein